MNRQSIIMIILGAIASLSGFATLDHFRRQRCEALSGAWTAATRTCRLESGDAAGTLTLLGVGAALVVGAAVGIMLYRVVLYVTGRARGAAG